MHKIYVHHGSCDVCIQSSAPMHACIYHSSILTTYCMDGIPEVNCSVLRCRCSPVKCDSWFVIVVSVCHLIHNYTKYNRFYNACIISTRMFAVAVHYVRELLYCLQSCVSILVLEVHACRRHEFSMTMHWYIIFHLLLQDGCYSVPHAVPPMNSACMPLYAKLFAPDMRSIVYWYLLGSKYYKIILTVAFSDPVGQFRICVLSVSTSMKVPIGYVVPFSLAWIKNPRKPSSLLRDCRVTVLKSKNEF